MVQLLLHLWGDYCFQPGEWANKKRTDIRYAFAHGVQYGLLFLLAGAILPDSIFVCSFNAFLLITLTHIIIDRFYPSRYIIFAKNWIVDRGLTWEDCRATGYSPEMPKWLAFWLMIVVDNTLHITINWIALSWL